MTSAEIRQSFLDFFREKQHSIVPSASLLPDSPNLLFTNAGMNQFVPIFLGQQKPAWDPPRVVDTQKCIRAGGKHNDLDDVGLDTYHHTFFEMLGNWSFGDYFKKEAIDWAWELVVERWKLPASRVYATVYKPGPGEPSEFDQEAHDHWARVFEKAGLDPAIHIVNGNKKDNFWMMGDTGPCGPCSELHIDLTPEDRTPEMEIRGSKLVNMGVPECIEIWNLVFIQYNAAITKWKDVPTVDGTGVYQVPIEWRFDPLPERHVDTGMGFERITSMIQGTKNFTDFSRPISNYETDVFRPIFDEIARLSGESYGSTLPKPGSTGETEREKIDVAFRVIADHIRTLTFAIADGIMPSNEGRGYVLRRILRRAVRYAMNLPRIGSNAFLPDLGMIVVGKFKTVFPILEEKRELIWAVLRTEENAFSKTLFRGTEIFDEVVYYKYCLKRAIAEVRADLPRMARGQLKNLAGPKGVVWEEAVVMNPHIALSFGTDDERSFIRDVQSLSRSLAIAEVAPVPLDVKGHIGDLPAIVERVTQTLDVISGTAAFLLYDTYGFPLDLTELMARERGLGIDKEGFERLMEEQRSRARAAQKKSVITIDEIYDYPTTFVGYEQLEAEGRLLISTRELKGVGGYEDWAVIDVSPFYATMGGQVGDTGSLLMRETGETIRVRDTIKRGDTYYLNLTTGGAPTFANVGSGSPIHLSVDVPRRRAIERHHTVTHLLHWALHEIVSREAVQKGSYVGPDKLTFDFSSSALTPQQKRDVEKLVNERVAENTPVSWTEIPYVEAKKRSDIQQFFGDKYGDVVRVVQIGGESDALNGYSMELCGGTHVRATGDIGSFRIVREEAIAAGIRRIEAVAGDAARDWAKTEAAKQQEKFEALARKKDGIVALPDFADGAQTSELLEQVDARAAHLEKLESEVHEWEKQHAKASDADLRSRAVIIANELAATHSGEQSCVAEVPNADAKLLQAIVDVLKSKIDGPIFLAGATEGRVALIASVPKELTSKIQANKLIQEVAPIVGGKGGGRPENAQGAGMDASKIGEALARARELISL